MRQITKENGKSGNEITDDNYNNNSTHHRRSASINMSKKCNTCWGYGLWAIGDEVPMGPIDFEDGEPNKKCPECGSGRK